MYAINKARTTVLTMLTLLFSVNTWAEEPWILRMASWGPPKHYLSESRIAWIEAVNKRAAGRITVVDYPSGQLYGPKDMHRAVARGLIDMGVILQPRLMATVPLLQGVYLPFAFDSMEQASKAYSGESLAIIEQAMQDKSMKLIFPSFSGGVHVFSHQGNVTSVSDLQNLRVLATSPMVTRILHSLDAAPDTSIPQSEQYMALKRGVADALLNGIVTGYFQRNHEVAPFLTITNMSFPTTLTTINLDVWQSLPADIQQIMLEEGEKQKRFSLAKSAAMERYFEAQIIKEGGQVAPLNASTRAQIKQISQQAWLDWANATGPQARRLLELNLPLASTANNQSE